MSDIIISYSSKDREKAKQLREILASAGLSVCSAHPLFLLSMFRYHNLRNFSFITGKELESINKTPDTKRRMMLPSELRRIMLIILNKIKNIISGHSKIPSAFCNFRFNFAFVL